MVNRRRISSGQIKEVMEKIASGSKFSEALKIRRNDSGDTHERIMKLLKRKPGLSENAYMGLVMKEFRGKISGSDAMEIIRKFVDEK